MPELLKDAEIARRLKNLQGWEHRGKFIMKAFEFEDFMEGIGFLNKVARVAEIQDHHPDISVKYATVTLSIQTHSEGGVTRWDLDLAEAVERIPRDSKVAR